MLDKSIKHGKEKRDPYRKSKRFDRTCRNHGACSWCRDNRTAKAKAAEQNVASDIKAALEPTDDMFICSRCGIAHYERDRAPGMTECIYC